jgi:hypothetical protein
MPQYVCSGVRYNDFKYHYQCAQVYVHSVEILTADYGEAGMTSSDSISGSKVPEMALATFMLINYLKIKHSSKEFFIYQSTNKIQ